MSTPHVPVTNQELQSYSCSSCGAEPGQRCTTLRGSVRRFTQPHQPRWDAASAGRARKLEPEQQPMSEGEVWLTEKCGSGHAEVLGVFSSPDRAKGVCQDSANEYFGAANTPPLKWLGSISTGYFSASYHHPAVGMFVFQATRFRVDERIDSS